MGSRLEVFFWAIPILCNGVVGLVESDKSSGGLGLELEWEDMVPCLASSEKGGAACWCKTDCLLLNGAQGCQGKRLSHSAYHGSHEHRLVPFFTVNRLDNVLIQIEPSFLSLMLDRSSRLDRTSWCLYIIIGLV